jgi:hypothetical protein
VCEPFVDDMGSLIYPYTLGVGTFRSRLFFHRSLEGACSMATAYMLEFGND